MNYCENIKCNRINSCDYPCEPYTDYIINLSLKKNSLGQNKLLPTSNDIENFLEYDVSDNIWLKIINREIPIIEILDENVFYEYFTNENIKYCDQEGLCSECRTPLKEFIEYEDGIISERHWACGNGC